MITWKITSPWCACQGEGFSLIHFPPPPDNIEELHEIWISNSPEYNPPFEKGGEGSGYSVHYCFRKMESERRVGVACKSCSFLWYWPVKVAFTSITAQSANLSCLQSFCCWWEAVCVEQQSLLPLVFSTSAALLHFAVFALPIDHCLYLFYPGPSYFHFLSSQ